MSSITLAFSNNGICALVNNLIGRGKHSRDIFTVIDEKIKRPGIGVLRPRARDTIVAFTIS
jgi:hypothetical protein